MTQPEYLTIKEAATLLRVQRDTIARWCKDGRLVSSRPGGGKVLIARASIDALGKAAQK